MTRPLISLGDALTACFHLRPDDRATVLEILGLLRLNLAEEEPTPGSPGIGAFKSSSDETITVGRRRSEVSRPEIHPTEPGVTPRLSDAPPDADRTRSVVRKVDRESISLPSPAWLHDPGAPETTMGNGARPTSAPLFSRVQRRGLLISAISTLVNEGEVDVDQLVEMFGVSLVVDRLPRLVTRTTRRGVQLLRDRSPGLDPFSDDQRQLIDALDDILDDDRFEQLDFVGCPSRGILVDGSDEPVPWNPPPRGTPIVLLSDLGIGGPRGDADRASTAEWLEFARTARREGHCLLALVPYQATRWPTRLSNVLPVLHWSERTTVAQVRHATRDANERTKS